MKKLLLALFLLLTVFACIGCDKKNPTMLDYGKSCVDEECKAFFENFITKDDVVFVNKKTVKLDMSLINGINNVSSFYYVSKLGIGSRCVGYEVEKITEAYCQNLLDLELTLQKDVDKIWENQNDIRILEFCGDKKMWIEFITDNELKATIRILLDDDYYVSQPFVFDYDAFYKLANLFNLY